MQDLASNFEAVPQDMGDWSVSIFNKLKKKGVCVLEGWAESEHG